MSDPLSPTGAPLRPTLLAAAVAGFLKLALSVPFLDRYGWDRDELYFLQASHHLAAGYVDFPPATALVGRLVLLLAGPSLFWLRMTGVVAGIGSIVLVALCVRELGGSVRRQLVASLVFTLTPFGLGLGALYHPTMLDVPVWISFSYVALRVLGRPEPRLLPLLGLIAGIGIETKDTVIPFLAIFVLAVAALGPRALLRDRRAWLGAAIALACTLPNLAWQIAHGWPSYTFLGSQAAKTAADTSHAAYAGQGIAFLAGALPLVALGVVALWRRPGLRALAVLFPCTWLAFLLEGGRSYYALPAFALPFAAGVAVSRRRSIAALALVLELAAVVAVAPLVWPVLPEHTMISRGLWRQTFYKDEIGWPELVAQTARAWRAIPAGERRDTVLLAQNYGEAGALARDGSSHGLPTPLSGHLSFQYWRPAALPQRRLLTVGFDTATLARMCRSWQVVARIDNRFELGNEERGRPIARCLLRSPLGRIWSTEVASKNL